MAPVYLGPVYFFVANLTLVYYRFERIGLGSVWSIELEFYLQQPLFLQKSLNCSSSFSALVAWIDFLASTKSSLEMIGSLKFNLRTSLYVIEVEVVDFSSIMYQNPLWSFSKCCPSLNCLIFLETTSWINFSTSKGVNPVQVCANSWISGVRTLWLTFFRESNLFSIIIDSSNVVGSLTWINCWNLLVKATSATVNVQENVKCYPILK